MPRHRHLKRRALVVGASLVFAAACTDGDETTSPTTEAPASTAATSESGAADGAGADLDMAITKLCSDLSAPWQQLRTEPGDVDLTELRSTVNTLSTDLQQVRDAAAAAGPGENEPLEQAVNSFERALTSLEDAVGSLLAVDLEAAGEDVEQAIQAMDRAQSSAVEGGVEACGNEGDGTATSSTTATTRAS